MTTHAFTPTQAAAALRAAGYTVQPHGARFLVGATPADKKVLHPDELIALAQSHGEAHAAWTAACAGCGQQFISDAPIADGARCPACAGAETPGTAPIGAASHTAWPSLPLIELVPILEAHAKRVGTLTPATVIPVPRGLPERLLVPIGSVVPGRYQPRTQFDDAKLAELADSIREHGIIEPPLVFVNERGDFELIGGERRLRAALLVGLSMLPVEIRAYTLQQIAEISGVDNLQRADLSPIEKGRYFNRLISELGLSENALAKRLGIARPTIQQCRAVAAGATQLHTALETEQITFSQARAIALAAPGDHKAQQQALTLLAERVRNGRAPSEAEARQETEKIVRRRLEGDLKKLGWQFTSSGEIWAESERPRKWTGAEMLEAVRQARCPSGTPPAGQIDQAVLAIARLRCGPSPSICGSWVGLAPTWSAAFTYYAPDELPALAAEVQAQIDAYAARAQAHGWTLDVKPGTSFPLFVFTGPKGGRETGYYWGDIEKTLTHIESGTLVDRTNPVAAPASPPARVTQQKCGACGQPSTDALRYVDGKYRCAACVAPILAAREAAQMALRATIDTAMGAWLRAAPAGALVLLEAVCGGDAVAEPGRATADRLIEEIATYVSEWEIDPEELPTVAALLGMTASAVAPVEASVVPDWLADGSPLYPVASAVANLTTWQRTSLATADADELTVTQAEAAAIRTALEAFADAPDVSDDDYERLSTALSTIEQALSAALAEVEEVEKNG